MSPEICIEHDVDSLYRAGAERFARLAQRVAQKSGRFCVALAGGSTPRGLYALLAEDARLRAAVPWAQTHFFWGDERHVACDHPDSNYRMVQEVLLSRVPVPPENVHRMAGESPDLETAAQAYEQLLRAFFQLSAAEFPRFDLALLGLGTDGHTASLFPGSTALEGRRRLVVTSRGAAGGVGRISLGVPVFNNASCVAFLVSGSAKARAVWATLRGPHEPMLLPAQLIAPVHGRLVWMLDAAAGAILAGDANEAPQAG
ncbi:MAG: 6-phosphogluconolactonase [Comamonadaceae bacterium]|nr:6-phosphogluconolactonase [Comamonadaceae bacterium]